MKGRSRDQGGGDVEEAMWYQFRHRPARCDHMTWFAFFLQRVRLLSSSSFSVYASSLFLFTALFQNDFVCALSSACSNCIASEYFG